MLKIELAYTIPNTWKLIFKLNNNSWKVMDCEKILSFPYAKELIPNIESFQEFKNMIQKFHGPINKWKFV